MTRAALAAAVRPFGPDGKIPQSAIPALNALADALGIPAEQPTLKPSTYAAELIKSFENCKLQAYPDPGSGGDPITIGWGSTGPGIKLGVTWTQQQADERFARDLMQFGEGVANLLDGARTTQSQFDALTSLAYNIGLGAFGSSTLLKKHKAGDYVGAEAEFMRWNRAGGAVMKGLTRRRATEAAMYGRRA